MSISIDPKKVLTEEGWKDVAPDCKGKDKELVKALFFYWTLEDDDYEFRGKALTKIAALAGTLKTAKEVTADPDAVKYLNAMIAAAKAKQAELAKAKAEAEKAAAATKKKADADAKKRQEEEAAAADGQDGDEEEDEQGADSFEKLKKTLVTLKSAKKPYYFLYCKDKPYGLVVSKNNISANAVAKKELSTMAGGSTTAPKFGQCRREGDKLIFDIEKPVPGMAKILQKWIKESTGLRFNKLVVGDQSADDEEEGAASVAGTAQAKPSAAPGGGDDPKSGDKGGKPPTRDPGQEERDRREKQQEEAKKPATDRMADAAKDLLAHYASENLRPLKEQALNDLARAWRESPGGVIAASAILGAAGVAYLVGTGSNLPSIPAIPLDFLAGRAPVFRGAELNIQVTGPITGPQSFRVSITFREQPAATNQPRQRAGRGRVFTPRMTLRQQGVTAASSENGAELNIEGLVSIPSDAKAEDVTATSAAIQDGNVEVDVGGSPAWRVDVLSVTDNYRPDQFGLTPPPTIRHLTVRLRTTIPPMFHQGADEVADASVSVRINRVSSTGDVKIPVHMHPLPTRP